MTRTVTFDGAPPPGTINLGVGQPSADMLPVDLLRQASESFYRVAQPLELNYGVLEGDERFLASLARFLGEGYRAPADPDSLFVTGGNSQALDLVSTVFSKSGDTIFVEEPSYYLAFKIFRDHGLNVVGVPIDADGIRIDALEELLDVHSPAFLYTIPSYHNPAGSCLSAERRARLVELSQEKGFYIVADEVYQLLYYYDDPPPALGTMIEGDTVLSLGSFSKILAPGMRLGWIQTSSTLRQRLIDNGFVNSGGSISHYASHIVRHVIDLGLQDAHLAGLRRTYRGRVEAMHDACLEHFGDAATWRRPEGGYFFWLRLHDDVDTRPMREQARALETGFQPGALFSSTGKLGNYLRLSFAHYDEEDIREGIARMRPLLG